MLFRKAKSHEGVLGSLSERAAEVYTTTPRREIVLDINDPRIRTAYDDALTGWGQVVDPKGRVGSDPEVATVLEMSLTDRFNLSEAEAWDVSSQALRDVREIRRQ